MKIINDIQVKAKDIVKIFSGAIKENNLELISSLLCTDGIFETQDDESNTLESDKQTFINWLSLKLNAVTIQTINYDNCLQCKMGNLVVSFNDGQFPRVIKDSSERTKTGLMLEIKNGTINHIKFCFVYGEAENKYQFECNAEKIKDFMASGLTFEDAYKKTFDVDGIE